MLRVFYGGIYPMALYAPMRSMARVIVTQT